jgi:HAD superfamily hydrolase (TIGR01509 family)
VSRQMIKAITFDLDGVYFRNGKSRFIANLVNLGVFETEATRVFLKSDEMNLRYKTGALSDHEFWTWALQEWGLDLSVEEIIGLMIGGYDVDKQVAKVVQEVRRKGYKTLVCSNNFAARIDGLQMRFGFLGDFDATAMSYEVGAAKPSREIFEVLVERAGVLAHEIAYADDDASKLAGVDALGIQTFVYQGFEKFLASLRQLGVDV